MFKDEFNITPSFIFHASFSMQICLVPLYYTDIQSGHVCSTSQEVCPDDLYMFTDFYTSFLFDKNLHEGMHIAVNSLRLD